MLTPYKNNLMEVGLAGNPTFDTPIPLGYVPRHDADAKKTESHHDRPRGVEGARLN
jgi:hypothetical protein